MGCTGLSRPTSGEEQAHQEAIDVSIRCDCRCWVSRARRLVDVYLAEYDKGIRKPAHRVQEQTDAGWAEIPVQPCDDIEEMRRFARDRARDLVRPHRVLKLGAVLDEYLPPRYHVEWFRMSDEAWLTAAAAQCLDETDIEAMVEYAEASTRELRISHRVVDQHGAVHANYAPGDKPGTVRDMSPILPPGAPVGQSAGIGFFGALPQPVAPSSAIDAVSASGIVEPKRLSGAMPSPAVLKERIARRLTDAQCAAGGHSGGHPENQRFVAHAFDELEQHVRAWQQWLGGAKTASDKENE